MVTKLRKNRRVIMRTMVRIMRRDLAGPLEPPHRPLQINLTSPDQNQDLVPSPGLGPPQNQDRIHDQGQDLNLARDPALFQGLNLDQGPVQDRDQMHDQPLDLLPDLDHVQHLLLGLPGRSHDPRLDRENLEAVVAVPRVVDQVRVDPIASEQVYSRLCH